MIGISTILILGAGCLAVYMWFRSHIERQKAKGNIIPGPKGLPFVGLGLEIKPERFHLQVMPYVEKYGEILQMSLFGTNIVFLNSVRLMKKCFTEDPFKHIMSDRPPLHYCKLIPEGKGSVGCTEVGGGEEHSRLRKTFIKGFHVYGDGVKSFEEKISNEIDNMIRRINDNQGKEFEFFGTIQKSVVSIISILVIGEEILEGDERYNMLVDYTKGFLSLQSTMINSVLIAFPFMRHLPGPWKTAHDNIVFNLELITKRILAKQKESYDPNTVRGLVDYILGLRKEEENEIQNGGGDIFFSDALITGLIGEALVGGLGTTTTTLSSTILCLLQHPEVQQKAQEEIFRIIGKDRKPSLKDKSKCPYIEAIFNEVQRYITLVPLGAPHLVTEDTVLEGYHIPAKSLMLSNNFYSFHDENIWGDPWTFRPERFLDENGDMIPRDHPLQRSLLPFSIGKRRCAGEEFARSRSFLFVATMIQRWTFVKTRDEPLSCDPRSPYFFTHFVTNPKPFYCKVVKNF